MCKFFGVGGRKDGGRGRKEGGPALERSATTGHKPPIAPQPAVAGKVNAAYGRRRPAVARQPQAATCSDKARFFFFF
jgi:hypothetical protein